MDTLYERVICTCYVAAVVAFSISISHSSTEADSFRAAMGQAKELHFLASLAARSGHMTQL